MVRVRLVALSCAALIAGAALASAQAAVTVRARSVRPGEVLLVTIAAPAAAGPVTVRAFEREWPAFDDTNGRWRVLIGIDLDTKPGRYELLVGTPAGTERQPLVVQPRVFPTRRLSVNPDLVHPPPEMTARVEREARELHEIWDHPAPRRLWTEPLVHPVPDPANSAFGTRSIYNGEPRPPHTGADFLSPAGRPIKAPLGGRVVLAAPQYFSGNTVIIDHGLGLFSMLAHLSEFDVRTGDVVEAGQAIGKVGATGRVTGPHLHWSLRLGNARVDPLSLVYLLGSAPDAQHEREERRRRRDLADPEQERPADDLDTRRGELAADASQPVVERGVEVPPQQRDFLGEPPFEPIGCGHQHPFAPVFLF